MERCVLGRRPACGRSRFRRHVSLAAVIQVSADGCAFLRDWIAVAAYDLVLAIDDGADGVDDGENSDLGRAHLSKGASLARALAVFRPKVTADVNETTGAVWTQREPARPRRLQCRSAQFLVGMDGIGSAVEIKHDGTRDDGNVLPLVGVAAPGEQLRHDARRGFHPIARPAGETDRIDPGRIALRVTAADTIGHPSPGRATAHVHGGEHLLEELKDRHSGRAFVILSNAQVQRREIGAQHTSRLRNFRKRFASRRATEPTPWSA